MILAESDPRYFIGPSLLPGAGRGLFTKVPLASGELLPVLGVLIPANTPSDDCTRFADAYKLRVGNYLLIPVGYAALVNHSSQSANMEKLVEENRLFLRTLRPIAAGEELLFCYSDYAQERFQLSTQVSE